ncbi:MAG TPA: hypothetical protein VLC09_05005, partial [Polyangiaceae bacterium]|nr:hypothetical protein [Polyangiaceae bacterium]
IPATERKGASLVAPRLVVRVKFAGFTSDGHLRAPVFSGVAGDKSPRDCTAAPSEERLEEAAGPPTEEAGDGAEQGPAAGTSASSTSAQQRGLRPDLVITNRSKIFWASEGFSKGDLLDYYARISGFMLPFLAGRPVVLVRYPDGVDGKNFYQWRAPEGTPAWIRTSELYDEEKQDERGTNKATFLIDDLSSLLYVINLGCIPLHVLASRETSPTHCDFLTIDFDIGTRPFREAIQLALSLRRLLDELGLTGFPKTSGQRGLHVLIPLGPGQSFETAKLLCELLGRLLVAKNADIATMERRKDKRGDKVYVDTGQTGRSRTIVAPLSARAFPGATVSTPLGWDEVHLALDPSTFTIETVPVRLEEHGDPWAGWLDTRPDLPAALQRLARYTVPAHEG